MIESVNHEGGHTTSRPGEHPSSKDGCSPGLRERERERERETEKEKERVRE
jgi:hypothetical protein